MFVPLYLMHLDFFVTFMVNVRHSEYLDANDTTSTKMLSVTKLIKCFRIHLCNFIFLSLLGSFGILCLVHLQTLLSGSVLCHLLVGLLCATVLQGSVSAHGVPFRDAAPFGGSCPLLERGAEAHGECGAWHVRRVFCATDCIGALAHLKW